MVQLLTPEVNTAWTQASNYLPTRQAALANWDQEESYTLFIGQQLQTARPRPSLANYSQVAAALQEAVQAVLTGAATPEEAAAQALEDTE
jgi:maltose-binding protein MalE